MPSLETLHEEFEVAYKETLQYLKRWDTEVKNDFRFYALEQWDEEDIEALKEEGRPSLVFDRTGPIIRAVAGSQITNRFQAQYLPRDSDLLDIDSYASKSASKVARWIQQSGDFEHYETLAFQDNLICGVGCTHVEISYDEHPDGRVVGSRVPVWEAGWDPASRDPNMKDARWVLRDRWIDEDELIALFGPDAAENVLSAASQSASGSIGSGLTAHGGSTTQTTERRSSYDLRRPAGVDDKYYDAATNRVRLTEWQRFHREYQTRVVAIDVENPDEVMMALQQGEELPRVEMMLDKDEARAKILLLQEMTESLNFQVAGTPHGPVKDPVWIDNFPTKIYTQSFHTRVEAFSQKVLPQRDFSYQFMTSFEDWSETNQRYFFGLMRPMRDPQKYANKFLSQAVHLFTANPKGALLFEKDMFENPTGAAKEWNRTTGWLPVEVGKLAHNGKDKFRHLTSAVNMRGIESLLGYAIQAVASSVGISESVFVGSMQDIRRTSGEAIDSVVAQGMKTQANPFDSLRLYRKRMGRLLLDFMQNQLDPEILIRIVQGHSGDPEAEAEAQVFLEALANGALTTEYDVVVEEVPSSPNEKAEVFEMMANNQFFTGLINGGVPIPPSMAEFMPIPSQGAGEMKVSLKLAYDLANARMEFESMQLQAEVQQMQAQMQAGVPMGAGQEEQEAMPPRDEGTPN